MKENEIIGGDLSPCVRIFIESLVTDELTSSVRSHVDSVEKSVEIQNQSRSYVSDQWLF